MRKAKGEEREEEGEAEANQKIKQYQFLCFGEESAQLIHMSKGSSLSQFMFTIKQASK